MKVAIVHDWLTGMRGGEKVLEVFCELFPDADIFTLFHVRGSVSGTIERHRIVTSFLDRFPAKARWYRNLLPLFPVAVERFDLAGYDLVLSSSHCAAKGVRVPMGALHVCYCHTPMRYVWDMYESYLAGASPAAGTVLRLLAPALRRWDVRTAGRVHLFLANSRNVAGRISRCYGRAAEVIPAPVDASFFTPGPASEKGYYLLVSALAPYKGVEVAVEAFASLERPLRIAGTGTQERRLRAAAGSWVRFEGWCSPDRLRDLYRGCRALIFTAEEDFGIVPLEAMACGKPVIAYGKGGVRETVVPLDDGQGPGGPAAEPTGLFFPEQSAGALMAAVERFEREEARFRAEAARSRALLFDRGRFKEAVSARLRRAWMEFRRAQEA